MLCRRPSRPRQASAKQTGTFRLPAPAAAAAAPGLQLVPLTAAAAAAAGTSPRAERTSSRRSCAATSRRRRAAPPTPTRRQLCFSLSSAGWHQFPLTPLRAAPPQGTCPRSSECVFAHGRDDMCSSRGARAAAERWLKGACSALPPSPPIAPDDTPLARASSAPSAAPAAAAAVAAEPPKQKKEREPTPRRLLTEKEKSIFRARLCLYEKAREEYAASRPCLRLFPPTSPFAPAFHRDPVLLLSDFAFFACASCSGQEQLRQGRQLQIRPLPRGPLAQGARSLRRRRRAVACVPGRKCAAAAAFFFFLFAPPAAAAVASRRRQSVFCCC